MKHVFHGDEERKRRVRSGTFQMSVVLTCFASHPRLLDSRELWEEDDSETQFSNCPLMQCPKLALHL